MCLVTIHEFINELLIFSCPLFVGNLKVLDLFLKHPDLSVIGTLQIVELQGWTLIHFNFEILDFLWFADLNILDDDVKLCNFVLKFLVDLFNLISLMVETFNFLGLDDVELVHFAIFRVEVCNDHFVLVLQILNLVFKLLVFVGEPVNDDVLVSSERGGECRGLRYLEMKLLDILFKGLLGEFCLVENSFNFNVFVMNHLSRVIQLLQGYC